MWILQRRSWPGYYFNFDFAAIMMYMLQLGWTGHYGRLYSRKVDDISNESNDYVDIVEAIWVAHHLEAAMYNSMAADVDMLHDHVGHLALMLPL